MHLLKRTTPFLLLAALMWQCQSNTTDAKDESMNEQTNTAVEASPEYTDHHSFAKPQEARVTHLSWKANVDFDQQVISATATYQVALTEGAKELHLDVKNLEIEKVMIGEDNLDATYTLSEADPDLGSDLNITIDHQTTQVAIQYRTTEGAEAVQWLSPQQTAGKQQPYLFTQSQAILARTWIPCQDGPGVRFTYDAEVTVPEGMMALMSAENPKTVNENGVYQFEMEQPVPSYLMALAVGNIRYKEIGAVTGVYGEPEILDAAVYEFSRMQEMVDSAELMYGSYRWGRYDVLVLPPSFPFGGMENPRLTFATPTIIAGDRSLTALIAHELAHSWSGNLVTNATWEDIWLNEGFTVYFEMRIMEALYGKDFSNMLALLAYQDLEATVARMGADNPDTRLRVDLEGRDPDDGLTSIPYDKGYYFLRLLEETVGREKWDAFLANYFDQFAFKVMTTDVFVDHLNNNLLNENPAWAEAVRINDWIHGTGIPDNCPQVESDRFEKVETAMQSWQAGAAANTLETDQWSTPEWLHFIRQLPANMEQGMIIELDETFDFTNSGNAEIQAAWFTKVLPVKYETAYPAAEAFLIRVGRRKFLVPIYEALIAADSSKTMAREIYAKARGNYHSVSFETLDKLLDWEQSN